MSTILNFRPRVFSNQRPVKNQADLTTTTTNGTLHLSPEVLALIGVKVGGAVMAASLPSSDTGLNPTFEGTNDCHYFFEGVEGNDKGQKTLGNTISDTNNKNVISSALFYKQLGGNGDNLRDFDVEGPVWGLLADADGNVTPVTNDSPEDKGDLYGYSQVVVNGVVKGFEIVPVTDYTTLKAGIPIFPITFVEDRAKQVKAVSGKGGTSTKAVPTAKSTFVDEFES